MTKLTIDTDDVARIIKEVSGYGDSGFWVLPRRLFVEKLSDLFGKEADRICPCGANLRRCSHAPKIEDTTPTFSPSDFKKKAGVE